MAIGDAAKELYLSGFSCGEAVVKAVRDSGRLAVSTDVIKACSAYKTGIGACKADVCGCLLAGLAVTGVKYGRDNNEDDISEINQRAAALYERFRKKAGTVRCAKLLEAFPMDDKERFMSKERKAVCADIVKFVVDDLEANVL